MFTYFHDHKNKYNKGQLAPVYILVLVIVIIMALVTVNLSKVAMTKTDTSNAADAGALATGAIMANVFNSVAVQNSLMITTYWSAYMSIALSFMFVFYNLVMAYSYASTALSLGITAEATSFCTTSCAAASDAYVATGLSLTAAGILEDASTAIIAIGLAITAASIAQYYLYLRIRRMAIKGRSSAIKNGHGFVFSNSGISSKLKAGSSPEDVTDTLKKNGYRDSYVDFMDGIGDNGHYNYSWKDGQKDVPGRSHSVDSNVFTKNVNTFELTITVLPPLAISTLLLLPSRLLIDSAALELAEASGVYSFASDQLAGACPQTPCCPPTPPTAVCCAACIDLAAMAQLELPAGIAGNSAAIVSGTAAFALLVLALAGLLPGLTFSSSSEADTLLLFDCWINDIDHDHFARVDTKQSHEGADLGLWKTRYPDTASYAVADFSGRGSIDPPNPRYGSDIVDVDKY
ncbi:MAG: pilus assembly protein TadG-related protein [Candidatus Omnitrophica bacterium]|nr:pilus assembly protein TadG-related protein [Candidatus Omnitrophota bacterium]